MKTPKFTRTPNWPDLDGDYRYDRVTVSVAITVDGAGLNRADAERICARLEKAARGRSKTRTVSAFV
jgi:hypothetical protein